MNKGKSQIAKRRPDLRSGSRTKMGTVFGKGYVADVMRAVLNGPMAPHHVEQPFGGCLCSRKVGNEIDHFDARVTLLSHHAGQRSHLTDMRPGGAQVDIHLATDADGAVFNAPTTAIPRFRHGAVRVWIGKIGLQILQERRLIAFDGQNSKGVVRMNDPHPVHLRMQGIGSVNPPWLDKRRQHAWAIGISLVLSSTRVCKSVS